MDILGEIRRLKQVELPTRAKDLYVGRGIRLPADHTINRPKNKLPIPSSFVKSSPAPFKFPTPPPPTGKPEESIPEQETKEEKIESSDHDNSNRKKLTPSPPVGKAPKPLKGFVDYTKLVDAEQLIQLQKTFKRLDSDADGHVEFEKIEKEYLNGMKKYQIKYLRQIYQVESKTTFFGEKEFVPFFKLIETIKNLEKTLSNSFDTVNFDQLEKEISKYMTLFLKVDVEEKGEAKSDDLYRLLAELEGLEMDSEGFQLLKNSFKNTNILKTEWLAVIPFIITLRSS